MMECSVILWDADKSMYHSCNKAYGHADVAHICLCGNEWHRNEV